jgi:light-regulated signal transduction histidine kinase (bacteriophytochrome)
MNPVSAAPTIDLSNCDKEPIHMPGSIQPHGFLLALSDSFEVVQAAPTWATGPAAACAMRSAGRWPT